MNTPAPTAARWRKSSHSSDTGGQCIEIAHLACVVAVRDSKDPDGPQLTFGPAAWRAFTHRVKASAHGPA